MDEVQEFCRRVLGAGASSMEAAAEAMNQPDASRIEQLTAAARACRTRAERAELGALEPLVDQELGLAEAVARELAVATAKLPDRQREALALRELLQLSHDQIASVMEVEPASVAPLLARARLRLRAERRGQPSGGAGCSERDRALRALARRQDSEPLSSDDDRWLLSHLVECEPCGRAHAAMLEASVCYRAWPRRDLTAEQAGADRAGALG
jgi:hypothetical protein